MPASLLVALYLALVTAPMLLATVSGLPARGFWNELATGLGLTGLAILLMEFALSGRFRIISGRVGMDVTMRQHQLLARAATIMILLHPFLFRGPHRYRHGQSSPGSDVLDFGFFGLWPGIVSWLLLGAVMVMALERNTQFRHEIWRFLHGTMALAMAGFGVLHALRAGRYTAYDPLSWLWLALLAIAAFSLLWVYLAKPLWKLAHPWTVAEVKPLAHRIWEVRLSPTGHKGLRYKPGHFAWISLGRSAFSLNENPFSIASAPKADGQDLRFVIKELGDFTRTIGTVRPGTRAYVDAPFGSLILDRYKAAKGVALIAGGVGIAPMLSHARELHAAKDPRARVLFYANRETNQIANAEELDAMTKDGAMQLVHVLTDPPKGWTGETGYVRRDLIEKYIPTDDIADWVYVLCGPPPMLHAVETALLGLGVPPKNILLEQFSYD